MAEILQLLLDGFTVALKFKNIAACFAGVFVGQVVGVLPGIGPVAGIAMLLPLTYNMGPTTGMIMLVGIYLGTKFGGAISAILINAPGDASSMVTTFDGYPMTLKGEAGRALGLAAIASFLGSTVGIIGLTAFAPLLTQFAINFGPPEYTALIIMGLSLVSILDKRSLNKALLSALLGLFLGTIGIDTMSGRERFIFGQIDLLDGIEFIIVAMGVFALAEILSNAESTKLGISGAKIGVKDIWPRLSDVNRCKMTFLRSSIIGFFIGILPGAGATVASVIAYGTAKRLSKTPNEFGSGAPEGVAAGETADNASVGGAMVPLLTLGLPGSGATAMLLGALIMYGVRPGPLLFQEQPELVWGIIASLYIGAIILLALNLPGVPLFASIVKIPYFLLYPLVIVFSTIGVWSIRNSDFDIFLFVGFGIVGYIMKKYEFPSAPLILTLILGPLFERALIQSLMMSHGSLQIFIKRPITLTILLITFASYLMPYLLKLYRNDRKFEETR